MRLTAFARSGPCLISTRAIRASSLSINATASPDSISSRAKDRGFRRSVGERSFDRALGIRAVKAGQAWSFCFTLFRGCDIGWPPENKKAGAFCSGLRWNRNLICVRAGAVPNRPTQAAAAKRRRVRESPRQTPGYLRWCPWRRDRQWRCRRR
jgi:hypothetical protein